uniref:Coiled-coil domain-containing protein 181 n=1 Tax=Myripristis murdjan TaxID=586833 RepID=A0A668AX69_9TELE
ENKNKPSQEEYEDDFEKDLDWLISEESRSDDQDIEAEIDKELEEDEKRQRIKQKEVEEEERWPSPMEPFEYDSDRDSPYKFSPVAPPPPMLDDETDEEKKYILEKIQQANRELRDQEAPDVMRRRRLHFKDKLVDLVVPPLEFEQDGNGRLEGREGRAEDAEAEREVSGKLSELKISPRDRVGGGDISQGGQGGKEGRVLVEKDGKFDLVSLKEVESQGLLPPLASNHFDSSRSSSRPQELTLSSSKISKNSSSSISHHPHEKDHLRAPRPPAQKRPNSASHSQRGSQRRGTKRRVQSATGTPNQATYTLSPRQKELLQKIQERKEKLAREAEQRKREEEEQKRQENEVAFKAWLMRKRDQLQEERRIQRAQEMERMNCKREASDPEEAFKLWLQRKQEQQQRERQLEQMKRLEEESGYLLHNQEECERAFKLWLKRKRAEKRAEQQAAREHSRRLVLEERRARRMQDLLCTVNEAKAFRFTENLAYRF